ncbi:hypothetical protein MTR67_003439, partial [Solanum verrucosum]
TWSSAEYEYSSSGQSVIQLESCLRQKVGEAAEPGRGFTPLSKEVFT